MTLPKFKVGDKVTNWNKVRNFVIVAIEDNGDRVQMRETNKPGRTAYWTEGFKDHVKKGHYKKVKDDTE